MPGNRDLLAFTMTNDAARSKAFFMERPGLRSIEEEEFAITLDAHGVVFERYGFLEQDELGIWSAGDRAAKVAWFKDPDGNVLSISQH